MGKEVSLPIAFQRWGRVILSHNGANFMLPKSDRDIVTNGFTLSVKNIDTGKIDIDNFADANWLAIGK